MNDLKKVPRPSLSARSSHDLTMSDTPKPAPRVYVAASLSDDDCQALTELAAHLTEKPDDYQSDVRFINLLHEGFVNHIQTCDARGAPQPPHTYELLADLRKARQAM